MCFGNPGFRGGEGGAGMSTVQTLPQNLLDKIRHGEDYQLEYKEAESKLPKNVYDTVSSFSNREGGDIFLGVHDCGVILGCDEKEGTLPIHVRWLFCGRDENREKDTGAVGNISYHSYPCADCHAGYTKCRKDL